MKMGVDETDAEASCERLLSETEKCINQDALMSLLVMVRKHNIQELVKDVLELGM